MSLMTSVACTGGVRSGHNYIRINVLQLRAAHTLEFRCTGIRVRSLYYHFWEDAIDWSSFKTHRSEWLSNECHLIIDHVRMRSIVGRTHTSNCRGSVCPCNHVEVFTRERKRSLSLQTQESTQHGSGWGWWAYRAWCASTRMFLTWSLCMPFRYNSVSVSDTPMGGWLKGDNL